jgi:hypothetical protein
MTGVQTPLRALCQAEPLARKGHPSSVSDGWLLCNLAREAMPRQTLTVSSVPKDHLDWPYLETHYTATLKSTLCEPWGGQFKDIDKRAFKLHNIASTLPRKRPRHLEYTGNLKQS